MFNNHKYYRCNSVETSAIKGRMPSLKSFALKPGQIFVYDGMRKFKCMYSNHFVPLL